MNIQILQIRSQFNQILSFVRNLAVSLTQYIQILQDISHIVYNQAILDNLDSLNIEQIFFIQYILFQLNSRCSLFLRRVVQIKDLIEIYSIVYQEYLNWQNDRQQIFQHYRGLLLFIKVQTIAIIEVFIQYLILTLTKINYNHPIKRINKSVKICFMTTARFRSIEFQYFLVQSIYFLSTTIFVLQLIPNNSIEMGQTCNSCQASSGQEQIKSITLQQNGVQAANKENQAPLATNPNAEKSATSMKESVKSNTSKKKSIQIASETPTPQEKEPQESAEDVEEIKNQNQFEKKKDLQSLVSQPLVVVKTTKEGIKLAAMPNYLNPITSQKLSKLNPFDYSRPEFEVKGAIAESPMQFDQKYAYQGQWKDGKRNGRGKQIWKDGSYYQGYWANDMASGIGRLIHADGDIYNGEWKEDKAEGFGIYNHACGATFQGNWKGDKQQGYGEQIWPDNAVYKGQYKNGKKHGLGKFEWADNSCYEGQFAENNISGKGKYRWKDGRIFEGNWISNKMEGSGLFTWPDGRKYEGQYLNDKKHGKGTFYWPDGRIYVGQWQNGKQHGKGQYKSKKGNFRQGIWQNGVRVKWLYDDGKGSTSLSSADA